MNPSRHAQIRMQQRGIPAQVVRNIITYGQARRVAGGATAQIITTRSLKRLSNELPKNDCVELERYKNVYVVMDNNSIITVGHRKKRFKN